MDLIKKDIGFILIKHLMVKRQKKVGIKIPTRQRIFNIVVCR